MKNRIKVGMIGGGFIAPIHIESLRRLGFVEVIALATSQEATAKSKAQELSIPRAYGDYRDLIEDEDLEVVHITSPNHLHFAQVSAVLEAGKHVICDKPLAMNSQQTEALVQLAERKGLVNSVVFNHRFFPLVWQAKNLVEQGEVGTIYMIGGGYHQDYMLYETDYNWRVEEDKGGALRTVGDIGSHWLDIIQFVTGLQIEAVFADIATFIPVRKRPTGLHHTFGTQGAINDYENVKISTEDYAAILLTFKDSPARGVVTLSQVCAGRKIKFFFEVFGSKSSLAWDEEKCNELWRGYRDKPNSLLAKDPTLMGEQVRQFARYPAVLGEGYSDSFVQYLRSVYEYIGDEKYKLGATPEFPMFRDGHRITLVCEAVLESTKRGTWATVKGG